MSAGRPLLFDSVILRNPPAVGELLDADTERRRVFGLSVVLKDLAAHAGAIDNYEVLDRNDQFSNPRAAERRDRPLTNLRPMPAVLGETDQYAFRRLNHMYALRT